MSDNKEKTAFWDKVPFLQKLKNIKHIELYIICLFVLILGVIYFSSTSSISKNNNQVKAEAELENYCNYLEGKLEKVLSEINCAGKVSVMITFDGRIKYEYATETQETTTSSSVTSGTNSKTVVNEKIIIINENGKNVPLIVREIYPNIAGVVVISSGAENVSVKLDIISAVKTLLDVSDNKIQVLAGTAN